MAQDDIILERIAPGPYNAYRKWTLSRQFSGVSRSDIDAVSGCAIKSETTLLGRPKSAKVGVTDDAVLISDGSLAEKVEVERTRGRGVDISERRDSAKENALATASLVSNGIFNSPSVERADVTLPTPSGEEIELKIEKRTKSGDQVVQKLHEVFPNASDSADGGSDSAIETLRKRYADGEISRDEFEEKKEALQG
jgi:hypothetical protein